MMSVGGVLSPFLRPRALKSLMHGQCDARLYYSYLPSPRASLPLGRYQIIHLVRDVCKQLAQGCYRKGEWPVPF